MSLLNIRLIEGKRLFDPLTGLLLEPLKIYKVPPSKFWRKRLAANDVEMASGNPKIKKPEKGDG